MIPTVGDKIKCLMSERNEQTHFINTDIDTLTQVIRITGEIHIYYKTEVTVIAVDCSRVIFNFHHNNEMFIGDGYWDKQDKFNTYRAIPISELPKKHAEKIFGIDFDTTIIKPSDFKQE